MMKPSKYALKLAAAAVLSTALGSSSTFAFDFDLTDRPYEHVSGRAVSDRLGYELGGGAAYGAASSRIDRPSIGFGVGWSADMMCGSMDMQLSIKNQLNGATDGFKNIMGNVVSSAQGAVMSLPALIIQRANPGLYELLSNGVLQGRVDFDRSKISCQAMLDSANSYMGGGNLNSVAQAQSMMNAIRDNSGDAIAAEQQTDNQGTENGVNWMGETRGGVGQQPIRLTKDVVRAAYNTLHGRSDGGSASMQNSPVSPGLCAGGAVCTLWSTPAQAEQFIAKVVGETELQTCTTSCNPAKITPGAGLMHLADEVYMEKAQVMQRVMNPSHQITQDDLAELSTPLLPVSRRVIEALRNDADGQLLSERLVSEIALADLLWKGFQVMRVLMSGLQNPDVQKLEEARGHVKDKIDTVKAELDLMQNELEIRKALANNTAVVVLEREEAGRIGNMAIPVVDPVPAVLDQASQGANP